MKNKQRYVIDLSQLTAASDIARSMAELGIEAYVYQFRTPSEIIKTGMSADFMSQWGERIYRQAGHLAGWPNNYKLSGSSGSDMAVIAQEYLIKNKRELNRMNMAIEVIDMTHSYMPDNPSFTSRKEQVRQACLDLERELITESVLRYGALPIGNKDPSSQLSERRYHNEKKMAQFFEFKE